MYLHNLKHSPNNTQAQRNTTTQRTPRTHIDVITLKRQLVAQTFNGFRVYSPGSPPHTNRYRSLSAPLAAYSSGKRSSICS